MSMASMIVNNRVHVASTDMQCLRIVRDSMESKARKDPKNRAIVKDIFQDALKTHHANQDLVREFRL